MKAPTPARRLLIVPVLLCAVFAGGAVASVQDQCGPFTDVSPALCPYVLEMYYLGITAGTSATTYSPDNVVTRGQAAVFVAKGVNQAIARSSRRAALGQWWNTSGSAATSTTNVGTRPIGVSCDGADVWSANHKAGTVFRVRASDGRLLETWTGATNAFAVLVAMGRVFVTGIGNPGKLYMIDPREPAGPLTSVANLGDRSMSRDCIRRLPDLDRERRPGQPRWNALHRRPGTWNVHERNWPNNPAGISGTARRYGYPRARTSKLDQNGAVIQTMPLDIQGYQPAFDGTNIWVPTSNGAVGQSWSSERPQVR